MIPVKRENRMRANDFFVQFCVGESFLGYISTKDADMFVRSRLFSLFCKKIKIQSGCLFAEFPEDCAAILPLRNPSAHNGLYNFENWVGWESCTVFDDMSQE